MKLTSLYIDEYKNIQQGSLFFSDDGYTALVGENGSGKSNWVEAVAAVCCHLIEGQDPKFSYKLRLDDEKQVEFDGTNLLFKGGTNEVAKEVFDLPKRLIVCYSGEDHRLWEEYMKHSYVKYFGNTQMNAVDEPTILYVNRYQWAIALITLLCSEQDEVKDFVKELWGKEIPLDRIKVEVGIYENAKGYKDANAVQLLETLKQPDLYMRAIKTTNLGIVGDDELAKCRRLYYLLYALAMPEENKELGVKMKKAVRSIEIKTDTGLSLTNLSEGHKKRILMMLMTRILGDEQTVYLLDEPDAHVDVTAKKNILDLIASAKGYTLMTTHSPIMTSMMKPEAVETVMDGFPNKQKWSDVVGNLSGKHITFFDSFLFSFRKKVFITEGKSDILYIQQAVERLKEKYPQVVKLKKEAAAFCMNGAGGVDFFLENSLLPIADYYDKILFLFDNDQAGKDAQNKLNDFLDSHKELRGKIDSRLYANIYNRTINHDFLVEDYFPESCYKGKDENIPDFNITGFPKYNEIKRMSAAETAIKNYIFNHFHEATFDIKVYEGFWPLLEEIIKVLDL